MPASSAFRFSCLSSSFLTPPCILSARMVATSTAQLGLDAGLAALDVDKLLAAKIGAETGLRNHVVRKLQGRRRRQHGIAAVRDIGERTAVDEGRRTFKRLDKVRRQSLLEQHGHRAAGLEIAGAHRLAVSRIGDDDIAEPLLKIVEIAGKAEDRHDFRRDGDVETVFTREAVGDAAQRSDNCAQRSVVHIEDAAPRHAAFVNAKRVAPIDMIIEQRGEQIVGGCDRVEVAGKVQVDVLHRNRPERTRHPPHRPSCRTKGRATARAGTALPSCRYN